MESLAELITRVLDTQQVELAAARELNTAGTYLAAQHAYGEWLAAQAETDAALGRLRARVAVLAHMPPVLTDLHVQKEGV